MSSLSGEGGSWHPREFLRGKVWIPLTLVALLGAFQRVVDFDVYWANPDEGIYFSMVSWNDWGKFWAECEGNAHPPLFYLILRAVAFFSPEITSLRMLSLVMGIVAVPVMFLFVREVGRRTELANLSALLAALLLALSPVAISLSHVIRPYSFLVTLLMGAHYFVARYLDLGDRRSLYGYAACGALALLTHYGTILSFGALGASLLTLLAIRQLARRQVVHLFVANAPLVLLVGVLYVVHLSQIDNSEMAKEAQTGWLKWYMFDGWARAYYGLVGTMAALFGMTWEGPATIVFLVSLVVVGVRRDWFTLALPIAAWALATLFSVTGKYPFGCSRHSCYLVIPFILPMASSIAWGLRSRLWAALATSAALILLLVFHTSVSIMLLTPEVRTDIVPEYCITREDMGLALESSDIVTRAGGVILMNEESYYSFMPIFYRERQREVTSEDGSVVTFRWGKRDVVVWRKTWRFSVLEIDADTPKLLYTALDHIQSQVPRLGVTTGANVVLYFAGWSDLTPVYLTREPLNKLCGAMFGRPGVFLIEFDIPGYLRLVDGR